MELWIIISILYCGAFETTGHQMEEITTINTSSSIASVNSATQCEKVLVPMCNGLVDYNYTNLPNYFNHTSQKEVYWALQPWWPFMDAGCSDNLRTFLCSLYLPRCTPNDPEGSQDPPCRRTCAKATQRCKDLVEKHSVFMKNEMDCDALPMLRRTQGCVKQQRETNKKRRKQILECQPNPLPMCQHMPYTLGSLPNPFMQSDIEEIRKEMQQYTTLVESGCSTRLAFLLCGTFMPFCIHSPKQQEPYVVPCREVCKQVQEDCGSQFHKTWGGLPWPAKLQCHRYPSRTAKYFSLNNTKTTVPCAMPPVGF